MNLIPLQRKWRLQISLPNLLKHQLKQFRLSHPFSIVKMIMISPPKKRAIGFTFDIRKMTFITIVTFRKHTPFLKYMKLIRDLDVHQAFPLVQNDIVFLDGNIAITTKADSGEKKEKKYFIICTDDTIERVSSSRLIEAYRPKDKNL